MEYKRVKKLSEIHEEMEGVRKLLNEYDQPQDNVNRPAHYTTGGIECIDIIKVITGNYNNAFCGLLVGNIIKYIYRAPNKNGLEDLKKAEWYLHKLISEWERKELLK